MKKLLAIFLAGAMIASSYPVELSVCGNSVVASAASGEVHDYGRVGDDPLTEEDESEVVKNDSNLMQSAWDAESTKYSVNVNTTPVQPYKYRKSEDTGSYYKMDVVRFSSDDASPEIEVNLIDDTVIENVTVYPEQYYPQDSLRVSNDGKTLTFNMSDKLRYCIVYINGKFMSGEGRPHLAIINDPTETYKPDVTSDNILNFKTFADEYLEKNPITDTIGEVCTSAGSITASDGNEYAYSEGKYVAYDTKNVLFPNKRVRLQNDVSDAWQAALEKVKEDDTLDTIYIPAGTYIWSGLTIKDWNSKPLNIYVDEDALMVNRIQECQEAMEPAIGIWDSSNITISGRGIFDGQGSLYDKMDSRGAAISCHQGGCMLVRCENITFNDTYLRDAKQWNWECHSGRNIEYNNIKGLSPYVHGWVDGLDLTSGQNIRLDGAITMGYDDTFASGHYNPSDGFRIDNITGTDEAADNLRAASVVYNDGWDKWDQIDSSDYVIKNTLGWTPFANGIRLGYSVNWKREEDGSYSSYQLKNYTFENFNSLSTGVGIRVMNDTGSSNGNGYPNYETLTFKDCSFVGNSNYNVEIPHSASHSTANFKPKEITIENCYFGSDDLMFYADAVENLNLKNIYVENNLVKYTSQINKYISNINTLNFKADDEDIIDNTLPEFVYPSDNMQTTAYSGQPFTLMLRNKDADGDEIILGEPEFDSEAMKNVDFDAAAGRFTWIPSEENVGKIYTVKFSVRDYTYEETNNETSITVKISVNSSEYDEVVGASVLEDTHVQSYGAEKNNNYGTSNYLALCNNSGDAKEGYLKFDLTDLKDRSYNKAILSLTYIGGRYGKGGTASINATTVTGDWSDSTIKYNNINNLTVGDKTKTTELNISATSIGNKFGTGVAIDGSNAKIDITELLKEAIEAGENTLSVRVQCSDTEEELYFVSSEGANGGLTNATADMMPSILLSVPTESVSISGPTFMTLTEGYAPIETDSFVIKGNGEVSIKCAEDTQNKITWDSTTQQIKIDEGLVKGTYNVVLTTTAGEKTASTTFVLTVKDGNELVITASGDTDVHSYSGDYKKSYSSNAYLSVKLEDTDNGILGQNLAGASGDGKIAYITFDISGVKNYDTAKGKAKLVLTYMGRRLNSEPEPSVKVNVAEASAYANGMTWETKPSIDADVIKSSEEFTLTNSVGYKFDTAASKIIDGKKVSVDITDFVNAAIENGKKELTLAVCGDMAGETFYFVSREGATNAFFSNANADMAPSIILTVSSSITYRTNGGTINDENYPTTYTSEETVTLPSNVTREGYIFDGWYNNASCAGDKIIEIPIGSKGNKEYWAKWRKIKNMVTPIGNYEDTVEIEKITDNSGERLVISPKNSEELQIFILYTAIYKDDKSLSRVIRTECVKDGDGTITVPILKPSLRDGETNYKLMLWDLSQSPLIEPIVE